MPWVGHAVSTMHDEVTLLVDNLSEGIRQQIDAMIIDGVLEKGVDNTE